MQELINKSYKSYGRLSRYSSFPYYYDKLHDKYVYGTTAYLDASTPYQNYVVKKNDSYDSIALSFYNNPTYYWIICNFNQIQDPFSKPEIGINLQIPVISKI